ncbi:hypothetical protein E2K80_08220 [Rhodophyticola sp. CCM32]|uniref:hypothetical protein n=1 Tax=Rhodophyticola sp. CCM32 TaxID=2916397 RepID=UPI00107FD356|nr:hypothetical protein [Rhodophyticola sp. CCM32]QBY00719.1 hypothetical protein E2K80_08220 [Rhodophyticola sp. CCM32]
MASTTAWMTLKSSWRPLKGRSAKVSIERVLGELKNVGSFGPHKYPLISCPVIAAPTGEIEPLGEVARPFISTILFPESSKNLIERCAPASKDAVLTNLNCVCVVTHFDTLLFHHFGQSILAKTRVVRRIRQAILKLSALRLSIAKDIQFLRLGL